MAKRTLEFTTKELHILEFAVAKYQHFLPDQTSEEKDTLRGLSDRFNKAYVDADYEDFQKRHV